MRPCLNRIKWDKTTQNFLVYFKIPSLFHSQNHKVTSSDIVCGDAPSVSKARATAPSCGFHSQSVYPEPIVSLPQFRVSYFLLLLLGGFGSRKMCSSVAGCPACSCPWWRRRVLPPQFAWLFVLLGHRGPESRRSFINSDTWVISFISPTLNSMLIMLPTPSAAWFRRNFI
jgi:hypothetical protein